MTQAVRIPGEFAEREDTRAWLLVGANLLVVVTAGAVAWHLGTWWAYASAFLLVGARGQACYVLQHEAMHNLLFTNAKTNERVGIILSAFLGTQFYSGRKIHWNHHRNVGHDDDPNEIFHNVEGRPPGGATIRFFLFHLLGGRLVQLIASLWSAASVTVLRRSPRQHERGIHAAKARADLIALLTVQAFMLAVVSFAAAPWVYGVLYVLPLATLTAFFEAIRSFSEHVLPGQPTCEAEADRRFFMDAGPVECFFISQFDFHYHHVHHVHPNVVTFKVRALHHWLCDNDPSFKDRFITRPGYVGTAVRYLFNRPFPGAGGGYPAAAAATRMQPAE